MDFIICSIITIIWATSQVMHWLAMRVVTKFGTINGFKSMTAPPYDCGFDLLPDWSTKRWPAEFLLMVLPIQGTLACLSKWHLGPLFAFFCMHTIVSLLRITTFTSTLLPDASGTCHIRKGKSIGGCHDLLFSGHTAAFVSVQLIFADAISQTVWPLCLLLIVLMGAAIVAARDHYTQDVIVAVYVTCLVYLAGIEYFRMIINNKLIL